MFSKLKKLIDFACAAIIQRMYVQLQLHTYVCTSDVSKSKLSYIIILYHTSKRENWLELSRFSIGHPSPPLGSSNETSELWSVFFLLNRSSVEFSTKFPYLNELPDWALTPYK